MRFDEGRNSPSVYTIDHIANIHLAKSRLNKLSETMADQINIDLVRFVKKYDGENAREIQKSAKDLKAVMAEAYSILSDISTYLETDDQLHQNFG